MKKVFIVLAIAVLIAMVAISQKPKPVNNIYSYPTGLEPSSEDELKDVPYVEDNIENIPTFE